MCSRQCERWPPGPIAFRRGMEYFYAIHRGAASSKWDSNKM
jgi:hypothetical protein